MFLALHSSSAQAPTLPPDQDRIQRPSYSLVDDMDPEDPLLEPPRDPRPSKLRLIQGVPHTLLVASSACYAPRSQRVRRISPLQAGDPAASLIKEERRVINQANRNKYRPQRKQERGECPSLVSLGVFSIWGFSR